MGKLPSSALLILLLAANALAAPIGLKITLETHLEGLSGAGWQARQIDFRMERGIGGEGVLHLTIQNLEFTAPLPALHGLTLDCPDFSLSTERVQCSEGRLRIDGLQGRPAEGQINFHYQSANRTLVFNITDLELAGGRATLRGEVATADWSVDLDAAAVDASVVADLLRTHLAWPLDEQDAQGRLTLKAGLSGQGGSSKVQFQVSGQGLDFSAASGRYAAQDLAARLEGRWQTRPQGGTFTADVQLSAGQLYLDPVFLDLSSSPKGVSVEGAGQLQGEHLHIERLSLRHEQVLQAHGSLILGLAKGMALERADITFTEALFPAAYSHYLQPFWVGTALGDLQTAGRLSGQLVLAGGTLQSLELRPAGLSFDDTAGRFGIEGLSGRLAWARDSTPRHSELRWQEGHLYRLGIDAGGLTFQSTGARFQLLGQGRLPVLDGAAIIERFEGQGLGSSDLSWQFDGALTPISMQAVSQALEWPTLSGKLSGVIPDARYGDGVLEVGGALRVQLFEGEIVITELRMENPLGVVPKLLADLEIKHLDLLALTRTFDFGRITGKLEGQVRDLRLENWEPVYFDAWLASPREQRTQRRISQRAVQNLSALGGGGAGAVLSRGFLGLFEEFNYKRLGIRCRLANSVCEMGGIGPANSGYYLVEGEGLPRIDVIGYNRMVDWNELLARLKVAIQSEGPVVR